MKNLFLSSIASLCLLFSLAASSKPPITCPRSMKYICYPDSSCPRSRCIVLSSAASPWIFLAPYKPLTKDNLQRSACSILPPGVYNPNYLASIYGPAEAIGWIAYCMYGQMDQSGFSISAFYSPEYSMGEGNWERSDPSSPSYVCQPASQCQFKPIE